MSIENLTLEEAVNVARWRTTPTKGKVKLLRPLTMGFIEMHHEDGVAVTEEIERLMIRTVALGDKPNALEQLALRLIFGGYDGGTPHD